VHVGRERETSRRGAEPNTQNESRCFEGVLDESSTKRIREVSIIDQIIRFKNRSISPLKECGQPS
jgi:hypothetical protein